MMENIFAYSAHWKIFFTIAFGLPLLCCNNREESSEESILSDAKGDFYYVMPKEEIDKLLERSRSLERGDSYDKIVKVLGPPTYERNMADKGPARADGRNFKAGKNLKYYFKKFRKNLVNELHDSYLEVLLDDNDKLISVVYVPEGYPKKTEKIK